MAEKRADRTLEELQQSEARYRHLVENASDIIYTQDLEGRLLSVNAAGEKLFGRSREEAIGMKVSDLIAPEDRQLSDDMMREKLAHGGSTTYTLDIVTFEGRRLHMEVSTQLIYENGKPVAVQGIARDITERQRAAQAVEQSERYFRALTENAADAITILNADGSIRYSSPSAIRQLGFTPEERIGKSVFEWVHPDDQISARNLFKSLGEDSTSVVHAVLRAKHKNGDWRHIDFRVRNLLKDPDVRGIVMNWQDVTDKIRTDELLKEREHFFRSIIERSSDLLVVLDKEFTVRYVSPSFEKLLGYPSETVIGTTGVQLADDDSKVIMAEMTADLLERGAAHVTGIVRILAANGEYHSFDVRAQNLLDDPLFNGIVVDARDISERQRIESALRTSEERFRKIVETSSEGIAIRDPDGKVVFSNRRFAELLGYKLEEIVGVNVFEMVAPEYKQLVAETAESRRTSRESSSIDVEMIRRDGERISVLVSASPLLNAQGEYVGALGMLTDITERKRLEDQLRQSQKIEAVGRLAGGIAHDFNNLLTAIQGHVQLLLAEAPPDTPLFADIDEIRKAADRAASLTQQLLAFSRRQILQPRVIEMDRIVQGMNTLLRRLIGEDIRLNTNLQSDSACVRADPGQVEQVLMNLAVNARDAMPNGGILTIETQVVDLDDDFVRANSGAHAGPHLHLRVADSGEGMDPNVLSHVFEPFFTTKALGKGTGLGLATVYGIVKQSGGYIRVVSEKDVGTRFDIFFPVVVEVPAPGRATSVAAPVTNRGETVLVAEDEDAVRSLACRVLRKRGYQVLEARDGAQALDVANAHAGQIHLLLTDVVMPVMGGRELSELLLAARPGLQVLYMSGYTDDALIQRGITQGGGGFIEKPFTPDSLVVKVQEVLEERE